MLLLWSLACAQDPVTEGTFGAWPLCEPSALLPLDDGSFLVADNEGRPGQPSLWVSREEGAPAPIVRAEVAQDTEALARVGDELWVMGSLSRNKECEVKAKRWRIEILAPQGFSAQGMAALQPRRVLQRDKAEIAEIEGSVEGCQRLLFGGLPAAQPVCSALVEAARSPEGSQCSALNVEGAGVVDGRVWVGWRAPLVGGKAVLARLAPEGLAFDEVRLLELGGYGVRELVLSGERLYGIAGPVLDPRGPERSHLFSVPREGLATGALPVTVHDRELPPSAEGLLLREREVLYVLDGAVAKDSDRCEVPARLAARAHP